MLVCPKCNVWYEFGTPMYECIQCKVPLTELTKHLKKLRLNQPKVTLEEAQEQAKQVMDAASKAKFERQKVYEIV